ncbi:MAG: hypothetical protein ABIV28_02080 [Longimicrobiales bacterium]
MWSLVERFKQNRARRKFMPRPHRRGKGTIGKVAIVLVVVLLAGMAALQLWRGGGDTTEFVAHVRAGGPALDVIERAAAGRRLIFLADVPSASAPKELAAQAIERLAKGSGLDVIALEIDAAEQPFIDRYLATPSEDAAILLARPRISHEAEGVSRAYIDVLRAVRRMNDQMGADQQIRIVALDVAGWPPKGAVSPSEAARLFGERDSVMLNTIMPLLQDDPKSRVLFFVGGLHVLKAGTGVVQTGGTKTVEARWLASRLAALYPQDVYSILVDATPSRIPAAAVAAYRGTSVRSVLRDARVNTGLGLPLDPVFDFSRHPVDVTLKPGIHFDMTPRDLRLSTLADAYIYLGS